MASKTIGQTERSATEIFRAHGLTPFRNILPPDCFQRIHPGHPAPKTILVAEVVFWLMATVALGDGAMAGGILAFWAPLRAILPQLPIAPVTEEAFCLARKALPLRFFLLLFADLADRFEQRFGTAFRWKGRRLLGFDGMDVNLARHPHLRRLFRPSGNSDGPVGCPQGRLVGLVGLNDGVCYAFRWTALTVSEQTSVRRLLGYLRHGDLLLADRNFPDLESFAGILDRSADFLMHLPSNRYLNRPRIRPASGRTEEWYVDLPLPERLRQRYPRLGPVLRLRILQYQRPGFRPSWLITSLLDTAQFPYEELVRLYHKRWTQETCHREWKYTLQVSNLRSHTAVGLLKEVLVQLTLNNAIRWIMAEAAPPATCPVELKFLESKRLILANVPAMLTAPIFMLPELYARLLDAIARQRILVRPGRSYPRRWDARGRPKGHGKIAAPARLPSTQERTNVPI